MHKCAYAATIGKVTNPSNFCVICR